LADPNSSFFCLYFFAFIFYSADRGIIHRNGVGQPAASVEFPIWSVHSTLRRFKPDRPLPNPNPSIISQPPPFFFTTASSFHFEQHSQKRGKGGNGISHLAVSSKTEQRSQGRLAAVIETASSSFDEK
jgi:hypothetical protein